MFADALSDWGSDLESGALRFGKLVQQAAKNPLAADPNAEAGCPPGTVRAGTQGQAVVCRTPEEVYIKATDPNKTATNWTPYIVLGIVGVILFGAAAGGRR